MNTEIDVGLLIQNEIEKLKQVDFLSPSQTNLFEEIPVGLEEWIYGKNYLGFDIETEKLSDKQLDAVRHGVNVYNSDLRMLFPDSKETRLVNELVIEWGKGSGKDFISAIITATIAYKLICLKSPQKYYGQSQISHIDMLNMAYGEGQAEQTYFSYLKSILKRSVWFHGKCHIREGLVRFDKNIRAFSGNSFEEAFEGKNLFVCVLDEIAAFKTDEEVALMMRKRLRTPRYTASAVYDMAQTSIASRFGNLGKLISISFPRYKGDFIQQLYEKRKDDQEAYVSFGATWEVNPKVSKDSLRSEYRRNPERSKAKYECDPSEKIDAFMKKPELIEECFSKCSMEEIGLTDEHAPKLLPTFKCNHFFPCAMHVDIGWKKDSCGIAVVHISDVVKEENSETKEIVELPFVTVDMVTSFIAPQNGEIDFDELRNFLTSIIYRGFNIRQLTFDSYNSAYFMQIFQKMGIETKLRSVDRDTSAYDDLKDLIYCKRIFGKVGLRTVQQHFNIYNRYVLLEELRRLVIVADHKVDHRDYGYIGKDEGDALAGAIQGAIELGYGIVNFKEDISFGNQDRVVSDLLISDNNRLGIEDREFLQNRPTSDMDW